MSSQLNDIYKNLYNKYSKHKNKKLEIKKRISILIDIPWKKLSKNQKIIKINDYLLDNHLYSDSDIYNFTYKNIKYNSKKGKILSLECHKFSQ